ncbi:hypothetical protein H311_00927 [Anncaliia algerae PRA109]|nr:hypothetical protein H311_00927 [Anncaliia algerae PRA109]
MCSSDLKKQFTQLLSPDVVKKVLEECKECSKVDKVLCSGENGKFTDATGIVKMTEQNGKITDQSGLIEGVDCGCKSNEIDRKSTRMQLE